MGERGADNEDATATDLEEMAALVRQAIAAGALGFSSSRTSLHKGVDGRHVPGTYAPPGELFALAAAVREGGGGVFQLACEHSEVPAELDWMRHISETYDLPVMFNLSQFDQGPEVWREVLGRLETINRGPAHVVGQVAGRAIGIVMAWRGTAHPFALKPSWLQVMHQGWDAQWAALQDPGFRRRLLEEDSVFGLHDRGLLRPGYRADLNVIDYDALRLERPRLVWDLPAGGRRLTQRAKGYRMTVASGVAISERDEPTGDLPGRLLRGPRRAPTS